jgi:hypothetical protein
MAGGMWGLGLKMSNGKNNTSQESKVKSQKFSNTLLTLNS